MKRRNSIARTALLAAVTFAPTACEKEDASRGGASGASGEMLSFLPKDSIGVASISWSQARESSLFKKYESEMLKELPGEVAKIKEDCGIDLVADINTIVAAAYTDSKKSIIAVKDAFDQGKVEACVTKMGGTVTNGVYDCQW
ncbi:MAG: hypothetical protein GY811_09305 [Myxococcales bacterium]|nr:hypothetical protein [Myxococcales bacterium]